MKKLLHLIIVPLNEMDQQMCCDKHLLKWTSLEVGGFPDFFQLSAVRKCDADNDAPMKVRNVSSNIWSDVNYISEGPVRVVGLLLCSISCTGNHQWEDEASPRWNYSKLTLNKLKHYMHQCIFVSVAKKGMKHCCG